MILLAIDPGPVESAWVQWEGSRVLAMGKQPNMEIRGKLLVSDYSSCVIEMIASYGMPVGAEVFETCVWIGRFVEASEGTAHRLPRLAVKTHLCHSARANDSNIRQAILDRFGGKEAAIGRKAAPGPLYGVSGDIWAALALAITWWDQNNAVAGGKC